MPTQSPPGRIEFRVVLNGLDLPAETQKAIETAVRRAVLQELAVIDLRPDKRLLIESIESDKAASHLLPVDIFLGLIFNLAEGTWAGNEGGRFYWENLPEQYV
jgi:hypothetical protein